MLLRLASYNVHGGVGRDGAAKPERIRAVIEEMKAEVVALQEVLSRPAQADDLLAQLDRDGYRVIVGPTLYRHGRQFGNALLTRIAVRKVRRIDLSLLDREPRGALAVDLDAGGALLQVIATHLGLRPLERRFQIRQLLGALATDGRGPVALLGDFNEWFVWGRPLRWLHGHFGTPPAPASFPSHLPVFALDRIWFSPRSGLRSVTAHKTPLARVASDHLPVVAEVEL